jgi:hypothetical protein
VSCLYTPRTPEDVLKVIEDCAIAYGGPGWASLAFTGLITVIVLFLLAFAVGMLVTRVAR